MKKIALTGKHGLGKFAIVDDGDFTRVSEKVWCLKYSGRPISAYKINGKWQAVEMHRFILNFPKGQTDHKNRNPLDNRKSNLRPCTNAENQINQAPKNGRAWKGVQFRYGKWRARITINQKGRYLGGFDKKKDALLAYNEAAKKYFGEFAWLNPV